MVLIYSRPRSRLMLPVLATPEPRSTKTKNRLLKQRSDKNIIQLNYRIGIAQEDRYGKGTFGVKD